MKRILANRAILLGAIVLCATGLVGAAGLFSRSEKPAPAAEPAKSAAAPTTPVAKQVPAQDPRCAFQDKDDKDDDAKEAKVQKAKPDTDDDELECGDQNDDDREAGEGKESEHGKRAPKASEGKVAPGTTGKSATGR